jgi:hypothetical protein
MSSQQNGGQITPAATRHRLFCVLGFARTTNDLSIRRRRCMRDSFNRSESEAELAFLGSEEAEELSALAKDDSSCSQTDLLIMMLNLLTFFRSMGVASFFNFPRYVGLSADHGMKTTLFLTSPGTVCGGRSKSHSHEIVACSRPLSGSRDRRVSFKIKV